MSRLTIREDDLSGPEIAGLLREHLNDMHEITPPGSAHALDLAGLRDISITFWSAWVDGELVGCGALKALRADRAEIKSMRTAQAHRRRGYAAKILEHIIAQARRHGYTHLLLETGSFAEFAPARALYRRYGFELRGAFGEYVEDPNNVFMEKKL